MTPWRLHIKDKIMANYFKYDYHLLSIINYLTIIKLLRKYFSYLIFYMQLLWVSTALITDGLSSSSLRVWASKARPIHPVMTLEYSQQSQITDQRSLWKEEFWQNSWSQGGPGCGQHIPHHLPASHAVHHCVGGTPSPWESPPVWRIMACLWGVG